MSRRLRPAHSLLGLPLLSGATAGPLAPQPRLFHYTIKCDVHLYVHTRPLPLKPPFPHAPTALGHHGAHSRAARAASSSPSGFTYGHVRVPHLSGCGRELSVYLLTHQTGGWGHGLLVSHHHTI